MAGDYEVLIIGGGLAGMTAGLYAARYGRKTAILERMMGGASIINVDRIDNYPGFPDGISGAELAPAVQEQAMKAGAEFLMGEAASITRPDAQTDAPTDAGMGAPGGGLLAVDSDAGTLRAPAVILAAGSTLRPLGLPGEAEFFGRGVSQCATCDGPLYSGETVGIVGGGDSAADEALVLAQYAAQVLLFHRRDALQAQAAVAREVAARPNIEIRWNTEITAIAGNDAVAAVKTRNAATGQEEETPLSGLFVYVGLQPNSAPAAGLLETDGAGHIPVNLSMETAVPGLYAVGDLRQHSSSQLISAAGDGATAALAAHRYLASQNR